MNNKFMNGLNPLGKFLVGLIEVAIVFVVTAAVISLVFWQDYLETVRHPLFIFAMICIILLTIITGEANKNKK
jgi:hypothetical protein